MALARASKFRIGGLTLLLALLTAGCASEFERRYEEAEGLRMQAAEKGYEWIATANLLEQARTESDAGNAEAALELADKARFQAEAALQQAEREQEAWQRRVVK